jgi:hypothetical protein
VFVRPDWPEKARRNEMKTLLMVSLLAAGLMTGCPASAQDASRGGDLEKPFRMPVRTELWAQTTPAFGGGAAAGGATADGEEKTFRILTVKHVYVGGIAGMFKGTGVVSTAPFVSPGFANGGMGGRGGMMGGMGGFGGGGRRGGGGFGGNRGFGRRF